LNTYDAILFDFDGVLVDSEPVHFECWSEILGDFGLSLKWESWAAECIGVSDRQMLERMSKQVHPAIDVETLYATYPRKRDRFRQLMEQRMPFFDGARELFESLHEYRLALVTSSGRPEVEPVLRKAGLFEYFDATVCFGEVAKIKPAPDPYLKAAEMVGAKRPLVVEDSEAGVESGRAAGFDVLRIVSPSQVPDALRQKLGM
jgi:HAD superfamily hydrolase (TIGR01509 family)